MKWQLNLLWNNTDIGNNLQGQNHCVHNGVRVLFLSRHCAANIYTTNYSMLKIIILLQFCGWLYLNIGMTVLLGLKLYIYWCQNFLQSRYLVHEGVHTYILDWCPHGLLVWRIKHHIHTCLIRFFSTYYSSSSCNLFCKFCQNLKLNKENNIRTCLKVVKPGWILIPT